MTRSTAAIYWAGTAASYFEAMVLAYEPNEMFPVPADHAGPARRGPHESTGRLCDQVEPGDHAHHRRVSGEVRRTLMG